ncbi:UDP-N-acetylglucosamine 4,6-dehydratase (inverting) [Kitasatospora phosalacinea]|uniref:UDP-N-acetylglucosamine 4,6-dehydratase (Inverting) n=1 Tax=Kitasatospora phosalacinea TaxID=2065 RepID=A0A9W6PFH8_9ACTN|nr:UDP-N-acetylglucosamine 4,6-dehydratase (inverting) [Kitasatospora phosalacinea]GLW55044.1 UDP-N-acetylglucosamine 4,6-dehydratase (inverting) [Kitasatospora phosalacinea]
METLRGASLLVTGATGSFGKALLRQVLDHGDPARVVVYSRDELKQYEARRLFADDPRIHWVIGDVRDRDRLRTAMRGVDHVVHAAALKQVDAGESNPAEFIRTNITGSQNVADAAAEAGVAKVVALSTDKACRPVNLYGGTKLVADKLFVAANAETAPHGTRYAVVRYGNVLGSRGSVVPFFRATARAGRSLPITDKRMTRFWIGLDQAVRFVLDTFDQMQGGELYVPRIPSMRITDLAQAIAPDGVQHEIGLRPGEKLHEEMIHPDDAPQVVRLGDRYIVQPALSGLGYRPPAGALPVPDGFSYSSDRNDLWLGVDELRAMLDRTEEQA